ncbi:hypothetical protein KJ784_00955 [Patescibacteria group bacterium]|nr:hypothetical protein [Patescibacteria group bacterium]MBU2264737.1 hypothetical protein [Patescibacteria group bacterium]
MKELKRTKFLRLREEIRKKRQSPQEQPSYEVGKRRQEKIILLLQELKEEGIIRDFLQTSDLSFQDIVKGIDFFIVYVDSTRYRICSLSVTGGRWLEEHKCRHPEIPVIGITENDTAVSVKSKIMEAINHNR